MRTTSRNQYGVSLIEVLVTMFILAIGLLGMAGLQARSIRATADSGNLGRATRLAYDMVDRIRLEVDPAIVAQFITVAATLQSGSASAACYGSSGCTGTARATADIAEWQTLLAATLPSGQGIVCRDASPQDGSSMTAHGCTGNATDPLVVKVFWEARDTNQAGANGVVTQRLVAFVGG